VPLQAYDTRRAAKDAAREAEEQKLEEEIARLQVLLSKLSEGAVPKVTCTDCGAHISSAPASNVISVVLLQAERDAADAAEAEQWIGQISVEGGGTGEDAAQEAQVCSCDNSAQPDLAACSRIWQCLPQCYTVSGPERLCDEHLGVAASAGAAGRV
jgi:hypothetical protein